MPKNNSPFRKIYKKDDLFKPDLFFMSIFALILSSYTTFMLAPSLLNTNLGMVLGSKIEPKPTSSVEEIPLENDLESFYNDVSKEMSQPLKANPKLKETKPNQIKPDSSFKANKVYKDGKPTIQPEPSIEHPQNQNKPEPITQTNKDTQTSLPKASVTPNANPEKIIEQAQTVNNLNNIDSITLNTDTPNNEPLTYTITGSKTQKLFGLMEVQIPTTVIYNAENGEFLQSQQDLGSRITDLFSF